MGFVKEDKRKLRLDLLVLEKYPALSRNKIQSFIMQGKVTVNGKIVTKAGIIVSSQDEIILSIQEPKYVSRAGYKLEHAIEHFGIDVKDKVVLDAGISTGGFTDCLLQNGAKKVYGVDVGYGQVHEKVVADDRVVVLERTNLRNLSKEDIGTQVDMITLDLSFISILKVMDVVCSLLKKGGELIILIKPQFEAERKDVKRGGIVKDPEVHKFVIDNVTQKIKDAGFDLVGVAPSPITGSSGNQEFLAYFHKI